MKTQLTLLCLVILLIINSCTPQESKFPQGAWQLVSWSHFSEGTVDSEFPTDFSGSNIVIFSEKHFLSVGRLKEDTTFIDNYVGATYLLEGNHCEETLLYFPNPEMVGQKVKSILELRNDTLIKTYPYDDNWELIENSYAVEKYIRLK